MQRIPLVAVILFLLTTVAAAQEPKGNVFFGYSYQRTDLVSNNGVNLNGWEGSLEGKVLPWIGVVADVSGHYGSDRQRLHLICLVRGFQFPWASSLPSPMPCSEPGTRA